MYTKSNLVDGKQSFSSEYVLWNSIRDRCKIGGKTQIKNPTYVGCTMSDLFQDFQRFAAWCNAQDGFLKLDARGRIFHLDKDILIKHNKVYSEDTCVFVPSCLNNFLVKRDAERGKYPIGVSLDRYGKYMARCSNGEGKQQVIGHFDDPVTAFLNYKNYKEELAKTLSRRYEGTLDHRVIERLRTYKVDSTD